MDQSRFFTAIPFRDIGAQAVKSVKSRVRELTQQGINPHKAAKMAAASVTGGNAIIMTLSTRLLSLSLSPVVALGVKQKSSKKKKPKSADQLFSGDGASKTPLGSKAAAAGGKFSGRRVDSGGMVKAMSKTELNKLKRGGKGKQAFKSKAKFKRKK